MAGRRLACANGKDAQTLSVTLTPDRLEWNNFSDGWAKKLFKFEQEAFQLRCFSPARGADHS
jgi:hypothetical protein